MWVRIEEDHNECLSAYAIRVAQLNDEIVGTFSDASKLCNIDVAVVDEYVSALRNYQVACDQIQEALIANQQREQPGDAPIAE